MDFTPNTAPVLRTLIAAIPDDRLRDFVLELMLHGMPSGAAPEPRAPVAKARRSADGRKGSRPAETANGAADPADQAGAESADPAAYNAVRHRRQAERQAEKVAQAVTAAPVQASGPGVSPEIFWAQARKLPPRDSWRVVVREFGHSEDAAREAERAMALPSGITAPVMARFLTLTAPN